MPEYRSITFELHSQHGISIIPEMDPFPQEHYTSRGIVRTVPKDVDETSATRSVYVPVMPGSMFWISYSVSPPIPDGHYFLFKLFVNGTHIVSWSTGKEEGWEGKTMFGLYERPENEEGKRRVEKRVLSFTSPDQKRKTWSDVKDAFEDDMRMEIKVHRAHGRKRMEREMEEYSKTAHAQDAKGIHLVNAGRASSEQPKRFYKFALSDPVDQPFATFRYYYRTWDQLRDLGFSEHDWRGEGEENDMPVIEPYEDARDDRTAQDSRASNQDAGDIFYECGDGTEYVQGRLRGFSADDGQQLKLKSSMQATTTHSPSPMETMKPSTAEWSPASARASDGLDAYSPRGAPSAHREAPGEQTRQYTPLQTYRLSVPPSIRLDPPDDPCRPLPMIPRKSDSQSSIAYRPHPAYPVEEWREHTPSPVKSIRRDVSTPPLGKHREGSRVSSLMSAISSTWKRRVTPSADVSRGAEGPSGARSTST